MVDSPQCSHPNADNSLSGKLSFEMTVLFPSLSLASSRAKPAEYHCLSALAQTTIVRQSVSLTLRTCSLLPRIFRVRPPI